MTVNVVEVATVWAAQEAQRHPKQVMYVAAEDIIAMAKVVLAAAAVVDADYIDRDKAIAALDAILEGK